MRVAGRDWHESRWLAAALLLLLLSVADAFMTLTLLRHGANEANPFMARLIHAEGPAFAYWKVGMTAFGALVLATFARFRLFKVVPVGWILYAAAAGYAVLVTYELFLLNKHGPGSISYWLRVPLQFTA